MQTWEEMYKIRFYIADVCNLLSNYKKQKKLKNFF